MKKLAVAITIIIMVALTGLFLWLVFGGATFLVSNWPELDKSTATLALISIATALLCAWTIGRAPWRAEKLKIDELVRHKRGIVYLQLLEVWTTDIPEGQQTAWEHSLWQVERELALCGTPSVLTKYIDFRIHARAVDDDIAPALGDLVKAMRKDLRPHGLAEADMLIELILNDGDTESAESTPEPPSDNSSILDKMH